MEKPTLETVNDANMEIKYSKLYADEINQIVLDSKYSEVNVDKTSSLTLDSKYDGINIDEIGKLKSISKYTNYKIGLLTGSLDLDTGYGSVKNQQSRRQIRQNSDYKQLRWHQHRV